MDPSINVGAMATDLFDKFCSAQSMDSILTLFQQLCSLVGLTPSKFPVFFPKLQKLVRSQDHHALLNLFVDKVKQEPYEKGYACKGIKVLVVGGGPCGLRTAIEAQLLGAKVTVIEKRREFSRNNVLHLWPFVMTDLRSLGGKIFYRKFCVGAIDHIAISRLESILLKAALLLGVDFACGVEFNGMENMENGWRAELYPEDQPITQVDFDVLIGGSGRGAVLEGFQRKELRAKLAIAITANFVNGHTAAEARVEEISGVNFIYQQAMFQKLAQCTGIELENIVYYKDETHYFVMTVKKTSLLAKGVLKENYADTNILLGRDNVDWPSLLEFIHQAVAYFTKDQIPDLKFALNRRGEADVALFDFTAMYQAEHACQLLGADSATPLLVALVGDTLLEPFWPTGSGISRGFLSSLDAAWMLRNWVKKDLSILEVLAQRESIYRLLAQTTVDNLKKTHAQYNVDPFTRYLHPNLSLVHSSQVEHLVKDQCTLALMTAASATIPAAVLAPKTDRMKYTCDADLMTHNTLARTPSPNMVDRMKETCDLDLMTQHTLPRTPSPNSSCSVSPLLSPSPEPISPAEQADYPPQWNSTCVYQTKTYAADEQRIPPPVAFTRLSRSLTLPANSGYYCGVLPTGLRGQKTSRVKSFAKIVQASMDGKMDEPVQSPGLQELNELRQNREDCARKAKTEALARIRQLQEKRREVRQERKERIIRKLDLAQNPIAAGKSTATPENDFSSLKNDDFFDEYKMRLYRKSQPTLGERSAKLKEKLDLFNPVTKVTLGSFTLKADDSGADPGAMHVVKREEKIKKSPATDHPLVTQAHKQDLPTSTSESSRASTRCDPKVTRQSACAEKGTGDRRDASSTAIPERISFTPTLSEPALHEWKILRREESLREKLKDEEEIAEAEELLNGLDEDAIAELADWTEDLAV